MPTNRPGRIYYYRGQVERGARYEWREAYSEGAPGEPVVYPWMTKRECQRDAKRDGFRAVFVRDGQVER